MHLYETDLLDLLFIENQLNSQDVDQMVQFIHTAYIYMTCVIFSTFKEHANSDY